MFKRETRVLGIDDGPYDKNSSNKSILVGTLFRGGKWLDGVLKTEIHIDGMDANSKIQEMITKSRHYDQVQFVFLDGITFAGFNIVDIKKLHKAIGIPTIVVSRRYPNFDEIKNAIKNLSYSKKRWKKIKSAGTPVEVNTVQDENNKPVYIQFCGLKKSDAIKITKMTSTRSRIPEPIRAAHLISTGIVEGDSYGNA